MMVKLIARFIHARTGLPLNDGSVTARIYDRDLLSDDFLSESGLSNAGEAEWIFALSSVASADSPQESRPDIYVELARAGHVFFQSPVSVDMDFLEVDAVSGERRGRTRFLGIFAVDDASGRVT
ncbi:MAG: hypothetical protein RB296_06940 [Acidobacteriota bacterium]|jgi:hypothetical protein|nr:hypothetical protein [Acidobacteriota bacterium]